MKSIINDKGDIVLIGSDKFFEEWDAAIKQMVKDLTSGPLYQIYGKKNHPGK